MTMLFYIYRIYDDFGTRMTKSQQPQNQIECATNCISVHNYEYVIFCTSLYNNSLLHTTHQYNTPLYSELDMCYDSWSGFFHNFIQKGNSSI